MRNDELFSPVCPNDHAKRLVTSYVMRGLTDNRGAYSVDRLLVRQHAVYLEWLATVHEYQPTLGCGFYEWMCRGCDSAFIFKPGDLVEHDGRYRVVVRRCPSGVDLTESWRFRYGKPTLEPWPERMDTVELKDSNGCTSVVNALVENLEPADIPPEVFALACRKANDCPMMKGGTE